MSTSEARAEVLAVVRERGGVPYAVALIEASNVTVTFTLRRPVWLEKDWPHYRTKVMLDDIRHEKNGWRAYAARFMRIEDDLPQAVEADEAHP